MTNPISIAVNLSAATIAQQEVVPFDQDPNKDGDQISPEQEAVNKKLSEKFSLPKDKFETVAPNKVPGAARLFMRNRPSPQPLTSPEEIFNNQGVGNLVPNKNPVELEGTIEYTEDNPKSDHFGEIVTQGPKGKSYRDPKLVPNPIDLEDLDDGINRGGGDAPLFRSTEPDDVFKGQKPGHKEDDSDPGFDPMPPNDKAPAPNPKGDLKRKLPIA